MEFLRGIREKFMGPRFVYNPDQKEANVRLPDGTISVGLEEIKFAVESAKSFNTKDARTTRGLSQAYIEKHFPQALADLEKAEKKD